MGKVEDKGKVFVAIGFGTAERKSTTRDPFAINYQFSNSDSLNHLLRRLSNLNDLLPTCTYMAVGYLSVPSFISHPDFSG